MKLIIIEDESFKIKNKDFEELKGLFETYEGFQRDKSDEEHKLETRTSERITEIIREYAGEVIDRQFAF